MVSLKTNLVSTYTYVLILINYARLESSVESNLMFILL